MVILDGEGERRGEERNSLENEKYSTGLYRFPAQAFETNKKKIVMRSSWYYSHMNTADTGWESVLHTEGSTTRRATVTKEACSRVVIKSGTEMLNKKPWKKKRGGARNLNTESQWTPFCQWIGTKHSEDDDSLALKSHSNTQPGTNCCSQLSVFTPVCTCQGKLITLSQTVLVGRAVAVVPLPFVSFWSQCEKKVKHQTHRSASQAARLSVRSGKVMVRILTWSWLFPYLSPCCADD